MKCSLRRRDSPAGAAESISRSRSRSSEEAPTEEPSVYSLRFDDPELQRRLIAGARAAGSALRIREDGAVEASREDWPVLNSIAHSIRDSCFRWYFSIWKKENAHWANRFHEILGALDLPFVLEHHERTLVFLLQKGRESLYDELISLAHDQLDKT